MLGGAQGDMWMYYEEMSGIFVDAFCGKIADQLLIE